MATHTWPLKAFWALNDHLWCLFFFFRWCIWSQWIQRRAADWNGTYCFSCVWNAAGRSVRGDGSATDRRGDWCGGRQARGRRSSMFSKCVYLAFIWNKDYFTTYLSWHWLPGKQHNYLLFWQFSYWFCLLFITWYSFQVLVYIEVYSETFKKNKTPQMLATLSLFYHEKKADFKT